MEELKTFIRNENQNMKVELLTELNQKNESRFLELEKAISYTQDALLEQTQKADRAEQLAQRAVTALEDCNRRLETVEEELDRQKQDAQLDWLVFSGKPIPRYRQNEDLSQILTGMLDELMDYRLDIDQVHSIVRVKMSLHVQFWTSEPGSDRDRLFRGKTRLRGSGLYIGELLTPRRLQWMHELRQMKKEGMIAAAFTRSGVVTVIVNPGEKARPIQTDVGMQRLIRDLMSSSDTNRTSEQTNNSSSQKQSEQLRSSATRGESSSRLQRPEAAAESPEESQSAPRTAATPSPASPRTPCAGEQGESRQPSARRPSAAVTGPGSPDQDSTQADSRPAQDAVQEVSRTRRQAERPCVNSGARRDGEPGRPGCERPEEIGGQPQSLCAVSGVEPQGKGGGGRARDGRGGRQQDIRMFLGK